MGVRFHKEGLAHIVKIKGCRFYSRTFRGMVQAGIPLMAVHPSERESARWTATGYKAAGEDAQG